MADYPEHEKMRQIADESQLIGWFLECSDYTLCEFHQGEDEYLPPHKSIEEILAEYFEIDLNKIEQEKRQMLEEIRKHNA